MAENDRIENGTPVWPGWETVRLIGRGSFGAVYEIERTVFGRPEKAAVKRITIPQNNSDIDELYDSGFDEQSVTETFRAHMQSIVSEYSLMREMNGAANVVNCDDFRCVQHDDGVGWDIFIKMELLTPLTKDLPLRPDEETVRRIARDMCRALVLCRRYGIIHRDIKPQNIFVSRNGDYKLGDFGIAKTVEKTSGGTKIGTYKYMAPEVYNNRPYGHTADIYSLGLVLHWMLNERRSPFVPLPPAPASSAGEEEARMRRFAGEPLPPPAHGSEELKRIVLKACAFEPEARYQSADEMLRELERLDAPYVFDAAGKKENTPAPDSPERPAPADAENEATVSGAQPKAQPYARPRAQSPAHAPAQQAPYRQPQQQYRPQYQPQPQPYRPPQGQYVPPQGQYAAPQGRYVPPRQSAFAPAGAEDEATVGAPAARPRQSAPVGSERPAPTAGDRPAPPPDGGKGPGKDKKKKTGLIAAIAGGAALLAVIAIVLALALGGKSSSPAAGGSGPATDSEPAEYSEPASEMPREEPIAEYEITLVVPEALAELTAGQIERFNRDNSLGVRFVPGFILVNEGEASGVIRNGEIARPDIFIFANDQTSALAVEGFLDPLPDDKAYEVRTRNSAGSVEAACIDGAPYAYPMTADNGYFMYYDRSVIPEKDIGSLESIIEDCRAKGRTVCYNATNGWYVMSFFFATGCSSDWTLDKDGGAVSVYDTLNSAEGLAAAKGMRKLTDSGVWVDSASCSDGFGAKNAAVVVSGVWDYESAKRCLGADLGAAPLPSFTVNGVSYHLGSFSGSKLMGVTPQSDPERARALHELAAFLCGEECQSERYDFAAYGPSNLAAQSRVADDDAALLALLAQDEYAVPLRNIPDNWWNFAANLSKSIIGASNDAEIKAALEDYEGDVQSILTD